MARNQVLRRIKQIAREEGWSQKVEKSAIETGIVESNLRNLPGGDADSQGWRQERRSIYKDPTNLDASIRRYGREASAVEHKYGTAGALAAAVQRPAAQFRGRYQQVSGKAQSLMGRSAVTGAAPRSVTTSRTMNDGAPVTPEGLDRQGLLKGYLATRGRPGSMLGLASGLGSLAQPTRTVKTTTTLPGAAAGGSGSFKITGPSPGRIKPNVIALGERTAALYGKPITGSDGTGHSRLTVNGNVSQHTTGNATDIPASGTNLIRLGQAALEAAGMPRAQARKQRGGLYNVNGHQIIFATNEGGNHFDHLHISAR